MVKYRDVFEKQGITWPHPVNYDNVKHFEADVIVLGGGIGGVYAAIAAAKEGAKVIVVDKAPIQRSGSGGVGHDHWLEATTNPASKVTPEEWVDVGGTVLSGPMRYICCKTSWDTLKETEDMGVVIRDLEDDFKDAPFRDETSKLLFAYDYENKTSVRVFGGNNLKPTLAKEIDRLEIERVERVMSTSLLTEDGKVGSRVIGATGVHMLTGEMYVFKGKTVIVATGGVYGMWNYRNDILGANSEFPCPNGAGDGHAMAYNAGAGIIMMERAGSKGSSGHVHGQPSYGGASCYNTHYPCNIVDSDGKQIPWQDHNGNILDAVEDRTRPAEGLPFITDFGDNPLTEQYTLIKDLGEKIRNGEYKLPLYMDLPSMPEYERKAIWGLMIGNEGKSLMPVYDKYNEAGFNPNKHLMQASIMSPERYGGPGNEPWWTGEGSNSDRDSGMFGGAGGFVVNWNLESTNVDGLYGAGYPIMAHGCSEAATSGRYSGRKAAIAALSRDGHIDINEDQLKRERERIYKPLSNEKANIGWRELQAGLTRIMKDYLGDYKEVSTIDVGMFWLESLKEQEAKNVYVRNPHELARYLEVESRITVAKMYLESCKKRLEHHGAGYFDKMRSPWVPAQWGDLQVIFKEGNKTRAEYWPANYELEGEYTDNYRKNFYKFNPDYDKKYAAKERSNG
jgi:succinate dehydrogenase/fumarate reductase flavoprotein subunit